MNAIHPSSSTTERLFSNFNVFESFETENLESVLATKMQETEAFITKLDNLKILQNSLMIQKLNLATRVVFEKQTLDNLILSNNKKKESFSTIGGNFNCPADADNPISTLDPGHQDDINDLNNNHEIEIGIIDSENEEDSAFEVNIENKRATANTNEEKIKVEEELQEYYKTRIKAVETRVKELERDVSLLQKEHDSIKNMKKLINDGTLVIDNEGNVFTESGINVWSKGGSTMVNIDGNGNVITSDLELSVEANEDKYLSSRLDYLQNIVNQCQGQGESFIEVAKKQAKTQNRLIEKQIRTKKGIYEYRLKQVSSLNFTINILFWIYVILSIAVFYIIIFSGKFKDYNKYVRYTMVSMVVVYPYVVSPLLAYLLSIFSYILHMITGETYEFTKDYDFIVDASYVPDLPIPDFIKRIF